MRTCLWVGGVVLGCLLAGVLPAAAQSLERKGSRPGVLAVHGWVFEKREMADKVAQAQQFDPNWAGDAADQGKAIKAYEAAIEVDPKAPVCAAIHDRVAQMYAFYEDRAKGIKPDHAKAVAHWKKCVELTTDEDLLRMQALMGIGDEASLKRIGQIDAGKLTVPPWLYWDEGAPADARVLAELRAATEARQRAQGQHIREVAAKRLAQRADERKQEEVREREEAARPSATQPRP